MSDGTTIDVNRNLTRLRSLWQQILI